jgi:plasmid stabilization system protein ParE
VARLIYSAQALADLERLVDVLLDDEPIAAQETVDLIIEAVSILENHPLLGHGVESDLTELVISRGRTGYIALYSYEEAFDVVLILAIRHQREAGFLPRS